MSNLSILNNNKLMANTFYEPKQIKGQISKEDPGRAALRWPSSSWQRPPLKQANPTLQKLQWRNESQPPLFLEAIMAQAATS